MPTACVNVFPLCFSRQGSLAKPIIRFQPVFVGLQFCRFSLSDVFFYLCCWHFAATIPDRAPCLYKKPPLHARRTANEAKNEFSSILESSVSRADSTTKLPTRKKNTQNGEFPRVSPRVSPSLMLIDGIVHSTDATAWLKVQGKRESV